MSSGLARKRGFGECSKGGEGGKGKIEAKQSMSQWTFLRSDIMCQRVSFRVRVGTLHNRTHNNWVT